MNQEQVKSIIRQILLFVGGLIAGTSLVSKFFTPEQVTAILTSDTVVKTLSGLVMAGFASFWGFIARSDKNLVSSVANLPDVKAVIVEKTAPTALVDATPSNVVPAGTSSAEALVK